MSSSMLSANSPFGLAVLQTQVQPSSVQFLGLLSQDSDLRVSVYKVKKDDQVCLMKVFRGQNNPKTSDSDEEPCLFLREFKEYKLLKQRGFCDRGVVPDFYGIIREIDVLLWPFLSPFVNDKFRPDAVFIEYIPNAEPCQISNFSEHNLARFAQVLSEFHQMELLHGDSLPRNMLVVKQEPRDRIVWIDFDCSQIVQRGKCQDYTETKFIQEEELMTEFVEFLLTKTMADESAAPEFWLYGYGQDHRGTPEAPGRVVTLLERSYWEDLTDHHHGSAPERVWGVAYRIRPDKVAEVKSYLDIREINGYSIHYTPFQPADGSAPIRTLVYIGTPDNDQFVGPQDPQALAEHIFKSRGPSGLNKDYLFGLDAALEKLSPESGDEHVADLARRVRALEQAA
ncbi:ChaC-like protein [Beauveria bassiana ARSEF 2860]|uniref:glutathione-specific gamma-glutamylcyclotransferase n=1 Tax=Beauveria bassiana (strain ARSEF 2860) TaxID=655819 RepID=J5K8P0_BEAB2|nr:ChaC-like protein [Beauveria bassiana ARSEF 2860]EJP70486.1 ChaC-like protein [Beauveria bassiana ARSEF 2860]